MSGLGSIVGDVITTVLKTQFLVLRAGNINQRCVNSGL